MMKTRSDIHNEMFKAFMAQGNLDDGIKASVIKGTGTGKSYDGIAVTEAVAIHRLHKLNRAPKILLLSNSKRLRDITWVDEFTKWHMSEYLQYCTRVCYQAAYLWEGTHWDLVIADEGDFALTEQYSKFFRNNTYDNLLLMTGYVADRKKALLDEIAPVCYTYTTQQAQDDGVLNKTQFKFVQFDLSLVKDIEVKWKNKVFYQSENDQYNYLEERVKKANVAFQAAKNKYTVLSLKPSTPQADLLAAEKAMNYAEKNFNMATSKRKMFLWNLKSSRLATKRLLKAILDKDESTKVLVFSKLTTQIDKIVKHTYHSKNAGSKTVPNLCIEWLNESEIRYVGVCDAINRGENLVGVDHIIKESYTGSATDFQQQHGRGVRLNADQTMHMFIMVPYYLSKIVNLESKKVEWERKPTQAQVWANNMVEGFDMSTAKTFKLS